jgi:hypothetical protein
MSEPKGNTAVPANADVDRVEMLSLRKDGSPDQTPGVVMIGDEDTVRAQAREQFQQQAVSAVDQKLRAEQVARGATGEDAPTQDVQDPVIAELEEAHEAAAGAAVKAADATVDQLFQKDDPASKPAPSSSRSGSAESKGSSSGK